MRAPLLFAGTLASILSACAGAPDSADCGGDTCDVGLSGPGDKLSAHASAVRTCDAEKDSGLTAGAETHQIFKSWGSCLAAANDRAIALIESTLADVAPTLKGTV